MEGLDQIANIQVSETAPAAATSSQTPKIPLSEVIATSTDREQVLAEQAKLIFRAKQSRLSLGTINCGTDHDWAVTATHSGDGAFVPLKAENRVGISDLVEVRSIGKVLQGKVFICRTISPAIKEGLSGLEVAVEEPDSAAADGKAIRLVLYNYSARAEHPITEFEEILPFGSFLALKNPWSRFPKGAKAVMLVCENPASVEILSEKEVKEIFPDCKFDAVSASASMSTPFFWDNLSSLDDLGKAERLTEFGNLCLKSHRYTDAIRWFRVALIYAERNDEKKKVVLNGMAEALLEMDCYTSSLRRVAEVLNIDGTDERALFLKGKCLIYSGQWDEAVAYLQGLAKDDVEFRRLYNEALTGQCLASEPALLKDRWVSAELFKAERMALVGYKGPISVAEIDGKGRGLIATAPLKRGQLVLVEKAFGYHGIITNHFTAFSNSPTGGIWSMYMSKCHDQVLTHVTNRISLEPELAKTFYSLTAGKDLGYLKEDEHTGEVDMSRAHKILLFNGFAEENIRQIDIGPRLFCKVGVWTTASYFNHSCSEANCARHFVNDFIVVIAARDIAEGEELTIPYTDATERFSQRRETARDHEFVCSCELCKLDGTQPIEVFQTGKILERCSMIVDNPEDAFPGEAWMIMAELMALRSRPELNAALVSDYPIKLLSLLGNDRRYKDILTVMLRFFQVIDRIPTLYQKKLKLYVSIIECYIRVKEEKAIIQYWVTSLKRYLRDFYGTLDAIRCISWHEQFVGMLERAGIDFYERA